MFDKFTIIGSIEGVEIKMKELNKVFLRNSKFVLNLVKV